MYRKIIITTLISLFLVNLYSQEKDETPVDSPKVNAKETAPDKLDYHLSVGTTFITSKGFGSGSASYVTPELTYKFTPRFHLNVGVMVLQSNFLVNRYSLMANEPSVVVKTKPSTNFLAFVSGDYLINDKLMVSGTLVKDLSGSGGNNSAYGNNNFQSMSVHLDYKLTKNITIGAGMHMSNGNNYGYPVSGFGLESNNYPLLVY
jgi:hypothetical protein